MLDSDEDVLKSMRTQIEKDPGSVEYYLIDGIEFYIRKECEYVRDDSFRRKDSFHKLFYVYPISGPGTYYLHRFHNGNEAYSSLTTGSNGAEYLVCRRRDELKMLEFFFRNKEMVLAKKSEGKSCLEDTEVDDLCDIGSENIEEDDLWQPEYLPI